MRWIHSIGRLAIASAMGAAIVVGPVSGPIDAATRCNTPWGSTLEQASGPGPATITNVRTGRHRCFDRLVIDGASVGSVSYVSAVLTQAKGDAIPLRGGAKIEIIVRANNFNVDTGALTYSPKNPLELANVKGYSTFRQVGWGDSFESYTTIGIGVRALLPIRIFTLSGPGNSSRLVIDVAHHW
jgi:hypothetical protein